MPIASFNYQRSSEAIFANLRDLPFACWLDSGKPWSNSGRYDIITALPLKRVVTQNQSSRVYTMNPVNGKNEGIYESQEDPFLLLEKILDETSSTNEDIDIPFNGGALGYFSYNLGEHYFLPKSNTSSPDMDVGIYNWAVIQDHLKEEAYLYYSSTCDDKLIDLLQQKLQQNSAAKSNRYFHVGELEPLTTQNDYCEKIQKIHDYIHAGDCYQVNFAQCFEATYQGDPYIAYKQLREAMASPFSAYIRFENTAILSLSPERFLQLNNRRVLTQPIKGTCSRNIDKKLDKENAHSLQNSEKNRAENLMIVDLLRNDIGKHCAPGTIKVDELFRLESFPNVHHLVSDVSGYLREEASALDLFKSCFPGGSITGAPKKRAMEIIRELEVQKRGIYCGSIAYLSANGNMDSNIAIRTVGFDKEKLTCWGGGGIVADSKAEEEYQESLDKVGAILRTLNTKYST